ncbi:hypothetical protein BBJ28_00010259 [Nothophytophthora sp. Chile5]|nr:hypothetical protein BBJ28_00010259 [Nothophytophthora sp. Chile5]
MPPPYSQKPASPKKQTARPSSAMAKRMYDEDPDALYRGRPPRVAKVRAIAATARLLRPTQSSLAAARPKTLCGKDKELAAARALAQRRRRLARVAKENGRLTIPKSPKLHKSVAKAPRGSVPQLTMTSRELQEIAAIRKRVRAMRRKTQRYHDATTHVALGGKSGEQFGQALRASGGVGVPAVRRVPLTTPVGFALEIDKRAAARKSEKRNSVAVTTQGLEMNAEAPRKRRRKSAAA